MNHNPLYTFTGCITAVEVHLKASPAADQKDALTDLQTIHTIAAQLLESTRCGITNSEFKKKIESQLPGLLDAVQAIRRSSDDAALHSTIDLLLESYYATANYAAKSHPSSSPLAYGHIDDEMIGSYFSKEVTGSYYAAL